MVPMTYRIASGMARNTQLGIQSLPNLTLQMFLVPFGFPLESAALTDVLDNVATRLACNHDDVLQGCIPLSFPVPSDQLI